MSVDWAAVRREFPALENWTFLNSATFGQLPRFATEAVSRHFAHRDREACGDFLAWFDDADRIREKVALLVSASATDIAFVPNSSTAQATLMGGIDWQPGDRVVTFDGEFPNNLYHPALLRNRGVSVVETDWEGFHSAVTAETRLVLVSTVNYVTGFRAPIDEIAAACRERNALLYVDGTQSVGALMFDAQRIQPAMLAVNAYKWLLGPTGAGFFYARPDVRSWLEATTIGWRSHRDWRRVDDLHHGAPEFVDAAEKYEGGMLSFPSLYAMEAAVDMMLEIGLEAIERRVLELAEEARRVLRRVGARLLADEVPHHISPVVAARFPERDASTLSKALYQKRIQVSARHGYLRVSTHFYNNETDLARLEEGLRELV